MKQKGVTKEATEFVIKCYQTILDDQLITQNEAFKMPANTIKGISMSGRTLRKIFNRQQVHVNTFKKCIEKFGKEWTLNNNKIDLKNEEDNSEAVQPAV